MFGPVVVERTSNGYPVVSLFNREDIEKVLRYPSKYPFRPPTEIAVHYRKSRPDKYASVGIVNSWVLVLFINFFVRHFNGCTISKNRQGEEWFHLRAQLTSGFNSRRMLNAFLPTLNNICDDFIELIRSKRTKDDIIEDFQELANLMGLESKYSI